MLLLLGFPPGAAPSGPTVVDEGGAGGRRERATRGVTPVRKKALGRGNGVPRTDSRMLVKATRLKRGRRHEGGGS